MEGRSRLFSVKENKDQNLCFDLSSNEPKKKNSGFSKANLGQIFCGNCLLNKRINWEIYMSVLLLTLRNCEI